MLFKTRKQLEELRIRESELISELEEVKEHQKKLIEEKTCIENQRNGLVKERDELKGHCFRLDNEREELYKDNQRLYAGHQGLMDEINFLKFRASTLDNLHESVVQKKWPHDGSLQGKKCLWPFERIEILTGGEVYTCCTVYLKHNYFLGNIFEQPFEQIWNSEKAKKLRFSVTNGNYEYCMDDCKWLIETKYGKKLDSGALNPICDLEKSDTKESWQDFSAMRYPRYITLTCDKTCNLSCPTCRNCVQGLNIEKADELYHKLEQNVLPLLPHCELLGGLGSGDIFASRAVSEFYKQLTIEKYPKLKLYLLTNMQLLTPEKWNEFSNLHDFPIRLSVSIDAANRETYEVNRRGASWDVLCENLKFFREWRRKETNKIEFLSVNFVVQKNNFRQMEEFIHFAETMEADVVEFQKFQNWGSFSETEFDERNVFDEKNLLHEEACGILRNIIRSEYKVDVIQNIL